MAYRTQSNDTAPEVEELLFAAYRRMSPADKVRRLTELSRACCELALIGLRARHPEEDEEALERRLAEMRLGAETVREVRKAGHWPMAPRDVRGVS